jgi:hypothetical protein
MGNMLRSVLCALVATHKRYDDEHKGYDKLVAELNALAADMKRAREAFKPFFKAATTKSSCTVNWHCN